jgi:uncharacterized cupin superfamily protein
VKRLNLHSATTEYDPEDPEGYRAGMNRFGPSIGAQTIGASIYELPEGQSICPYHYEYGNEEWLIVLEGRPTLRHPGGADELAQGDVVCFPVGPEGAHKVTNRTAETVRVLMISTKFEPSVAVYPDSDKIGVWPGDDRDRVMLRREDGAVEYYDREL